MLCVFSKEELAMMRDSIKMAIKLNHTTPSFRFNDMLDLYQSVCTYCAQKEDNTSKCADNIPICESEVIK